jgi:hypothetical protein
METSVEEVTTVGPELAKHVFQAQGASTSDATLPRRWPAFVAMIAIYYLMVFKPAL